MKGLRLLVLFVAIVWFSRNARADTQVFLGGGIHSLKLSNSLTESTYTTPGKISSFSIELLRTLKKGRFSLGVRAGYLATSILAGDAELTYTQIPVFGTLGYVLGSPMVQLRLSAGAGYPLKNLMTITGSGTATDGEYAGQNLMLISAAQLLLFLGRKSRLGVFVEVGYVYSFGKILFHEPFTSDDLDGDASGYFLQGGGVWRF